MRRWKETDAQKVSWVKWALTVSPDKLTPEQKLRMIGNIVNK